jgi:hypothetical protein
MADNQPNRGRGSAACGGLMGLRAALFLSLAAVMLCGCSGTPKRDRDILQKYFPDDSPVSALVGFIFAVETSSWDSAYSRLSASSREKINSFKFKYGLPLVKDPRTGIPVVEIITGAITDRALLPQVPGQSKNISRVQLNYYGKDSDGRLAAYLVVVYLTDERKPGAEEAVWKIDLLRTAEKLSGN